ncbi:MAG TPA: DUF2069 domain-containing protein [Burkholderiaceae bacterium]|jgi:uncharacterized membrane protein|nr:DUF2069 domain-containing protein [Burkholderiaceae bacterium]
MVAAPMTPDRVTTLSRLAAVAAALALAALAVAWELVWARTGNGTLVVKALPFVAALPGLLKHRMYTYRWVSLLVWLYVAEAIVRIGDRWPSNACAWAELVLALVLFAACATQVRWRHTVARRLPQAGDPRAGAGVEH